MNKSKGRSAFYPSRRSEPRLGAIDLLDESLADGPADEQSTATVPSSPGKRWRRWLVSLLLLCLLTLLIMVLWLNQGSLRTLIPRSKSNELLYRAQIALRTGHLDGTHGDSARELYEAVHVLKPDDDRALLGLQQVGEIELAHAKLALRQNKFSIAEQLWVSAHNLLGDSDGVAQLHRALVAARDKHAQAQPSATGKLPRPQTPAVTAMSHPSVRTAATPTKQADLKAQQQVRAAELVRRAQIAAAQGQIMLPPGQSAYDLYRSALAIDGDNMTARAGLASLPVLVTQLFNRALDTGNLDVAGKWLTTLTHLSTPDAHLERLRQRLVGAWIQQAKRQLDQADAAAAARALEQVRRLRSNTPQGVPDSPTVTPGT